MDLVGGSSFREDARQVIESLGLVSMRTMLNKDIGDVIKFVTTEHQ